MSKLGLGIDAGGTSTRWALADAGGTVIAEGSAPAATALQMGSDSGRAALRATFAEIARGISGRAGSVVAGMTGFSDGHGAEPLIALMAETLGVDAAAFTISNDVEIAYLDVFAPGEGYLVYAGTGSIGVFVDERRTFHRVGGLGGILDDAGGGFWIAVSALRAVWRLEDEKPGAGLGSPLGRELSASIGGADWNAARDFVYAGGFEANRGKIGKLALAVAKAADEDETARGILVAAGEELARMGRILIERFGPRPIAIGGRVVLLHAAIEKALREGLNGASVSLRASDAHHAAARIAAKSG